MEVHDPRIPARSSGRSASSLSGLTVTAAAEALGVTRKALSDLLNGHTGVSPDTAIRLEKVFGSTAGTWLWMQMERDLWEVRQRADEIKIKTRFATTALCQRSEPRVALHPRPSPRTAGRGRDPWIPPDQVRGGG
jgi:antitoxin HigA-1